MNPVRIRKTPATERAGVIFGGSGNEPSCFSSALFVAFDDIGSGSSMAEVTEGAALVPVEALPDDNEFEDTALLAPAVGLTESVLVSDGDSELDAAWTVDGLLDVDGFGTVSVLEAVGVTVAPSSCWRATAVGSASAGHAQNTMQAESHISALATRML